MTKNKTFKDTELEMQTADNSSENMTNIHENADSDSKEVDEADNLADKLSAIKDTHLRLVAEYDNYRKRTLKEKADLIRNGGERTLCDLLPVIDDFDRALSNMNPSMGAETVSEGLNLIYQKFISYINKQGLKSIETEDKVFDDDLFEAIATIPATSEDLKGRVIDCTQKGYMLNGKVIRHAKVVVAE
ncbi:protein GrpE [Bacteroidales bacterium]|nr:protein GrpE [Bacteroidales bacterium]